MLDFRTKPPTLAAITAALPRRAPEGARVTAPGQRRYGAAQTIGMSSTSISRPRGPRGGVARRGGVERVLAGRAVAPRQDWPSPGRGAGGAAAVGGGGGGGGAGAPRPRTGGAAPPRARAVRRRLWRRGSAGGGAR